MKTVLSLVARVRPSRSQAGQILVLVALAFPVLTGFAGLAIDVGILMARRTSEQRAADAAAIAGAQKWLTDGKDLSDEEAITFATKNGYTNGVKSTSVAISYPTSCGITETYTDCIKVTISRTASTLFLRVLGRDTATVSVSAIGAIELSPRPYALIVLNENECLAYDHSGTGDLVLNGGGAIVNSDGSESGCDGVTAEQSGGAIVTATSCYTTDDPPELIPCTLDHLIGTDWEYPSGQASPAPTTVGRPVEDPLAGLGRPVPCTNSAGTTPSGCIPRSATSDGAYNTCGGTGPITSDTTLQPGTYYGGLKITGNANITFMPGLYVFAGGGPTQGGFDWNSSGTGSVGGSSSQGVTFFNTDFEGCPGSAKDACGGFNIHASGTLTLRAPEDAGDKGPLDDGPANSGDLDNGIETLVIWQNDTCRSDDCNDAEAFQYAGTTNTIAGIVYLPEACLNMSGGGTFGAAQIIVDTYKYSGSNNTTVNYENYVDVRRPRWVLAE